MFKLQLEEVEKEKEKEEDSIEDWFVKEVKERLKTKRNFLCVIHGPTGSGKSYLALRISEVLDPTFNVDRVLFDPEDFFKLVTKLPQDSFVVIDEAGAILDARRFMTTINCITSYVLETFRFKRVNVIFTLPSIKMVDVNVRRLMHCLVFQEDRGRARIYKVAMSYDGSTYIRRIGTFNNVPLPKKELCEAYEKKKNEAFEGLLKEAMTAMGIEEEEKPVVEKKPIDWSFWNQIMGGEKKDA